MAVRFNDNLSSMYRYATPQKYTAIAECKVLSTLYRPFMYIYIPTVCEHRPVVHSLFVAVAIHDKSAFAQADANLSSVNAVRCAYYLTVSSCFQRY
jgi:hypothetical protein